MQDQTNYFSSNLETEKESHVNDRNAKQSNRNNKKKMYSMGWSVDFTNS